MAVWHSVTYHVPQQVKRVKESEAMRQESRAAVPEGGLSDLGGYQEVVAMLSEVLACREGEVHERLFREVLSPGWNVCQAVASADVTPHIWNRPMENSYTNSEAFAFELVVSHLSLANEEIDRCVIQAVTEMHPAGLGHRLLALVDGIGSGTVYFAMPDSLPPTRITPGRLQASRADVRRRWGRRRMGPSFLPRNDSLAEGLAS